MQNKTILTSFKAFPAMPQNLQLRMLKNIEKNAYQLTPEQIEAKQMRAQLLKQCKIQEQQNKLLKYNQKATLVHQQKVLSNLAQNKLQKDIYEMKMKIAQENASQQMIEKIMKYQMFGTQKILEAKDRKFQMQMQTNPTVQQQAEIAMKEKDTKIIEKLNKMDKETRLQEFTKRQNQYMTKKLQTTEEKQQKAQLIRQKLQDEKVAKAVQSTEIKLMKKITIQPEQNYAEAVRNAVKQQYLEKAQSLILSKQEKADARRKELQNQKIHKAQKMAKPTGVKVPEAKRCELIKNMEPSMAQKLKGVSWKVCTETFGRIAGSEIEKAKTHRVEMPKPKKAESWSILH